MNKRRIYLVAAAVLGFAVAGTALAHGWRGAGGKGAWALEHIAQELELNDYQQQKLAAVRQAMRESRQAARAGFAERRQAMLGLIEQPTFDRAGAQALLEQSTRAMNQRGQQLIGAIGEFYDSLAADQQQKLRTALAERMERASKHRRFRRSGS